MIIFKGEHMKKTKIIGTIGPASIGYDVMKSLVLNGLNVVRINLSHAKLKDMETILKNVKKIRKELGVPLPIMIDTRGPELRVKTFESGSVDIKKVNFSLSQQKTLLVTQLEFLLIIHKYYLMSRLGIKSWLLMDYSLLRWWKFKELML